MKNAAWFIAGGAALAVAFLAQNPYMAFAVYAFLLLALLAHISSVAWLSGLDCARRVSAQTVQQGEDVEILVDIENRRGWPIPWIYLEDYCPPGCVLAGENRRLAVLMPGRTITLAYRLTFPMRGYHRIGPLMMESGDLFGLQRRFRTGERRDYVSVLPTVAYIDTFNIAAKRPQGPVRVSNRIYADPTRINAIRAYVPGDPLNSIHWKATARTGELQVKTLESSSVTGGTVVLDLHGDSFKPEGREERFELAITTAASIAYLLQMSGEQVGLLTNARDAAEAARYEAESIETMSRFEMDDALPEDTDPDRISPLSVPTRKGSIQAQRILENLARVLPGAGLDATGLIRLGHPRLPRDASLLIVAPIVTETLALALAAMRQIGFGVTVFLIKDDAAYAEAARLLAPHAISVIHIEHERHLHEINPAAIGH